jgi:hypothetical protein
MGDDSWSPVEDTVTPGQWSDVRTWVFRGNILIIVTDAPASLPRSLQQELINSNFENVPATSGETRSAHAGEPDADFAQIPVSTGGSLTVKPNGPRWRVSSESQTKPSPVGGQLSTKIDQSDAAARWQLAADQRGGVLFRIPLGKGAVYFLLDRSAWTNEGLDHGENARVLADMLGRELRGGELAFDEYRHGHGRGESFLAYFLNLPGSSAFVWLCAIWGLLYLYGRNVRLRPAEAYIERERRTAQEYIDAVAQLYERARVAPLVVEAVARRLRQISRSAADQPPAVTALLHEAETYVKVGDRPASPAAAAILVNELIQLRKRIYGHRTVS